MAQPPVNGRELVAEDVKFTYDRFRTEQGNANRYMLDPVERVEVVDRYTVKFLLEEPYVWLVNTLASPWRTYFVLDLVPFIEKMAAAARRRVMITLWSVPTANQSATLFRLVYGEEQAPVPGHQALLPVLWEIGLLPDVRVLPDAPQVPGAPRQVGLPQTHQDAVHWALQGRWLRPDDQARARDLVEAHFHALFAQRPEGFSSLWHQEARRRLITWETDKRR